MLSWGRFLSIQRKIIALMSNYKVMKTIEKRAIEEKAMEE